MSKATITWIPSEALREGRQQVPRKNVRVMLGSEIHPDLIDIKWVDGYGIIYDANPSPWTHFADLPKGPS